MEAELGTLDRLILSDAAWHRMSPHIIGDERSSGTSGRDNRLFVEGVLWIVRTGAPWRDLPEIFGGWNSVFRRFSRWSKKGIWHRLFEAMADDPDFEYLIVDSTIIRAHQHSAGAKKDPMGDGLASIGKLWVRHLRSGGPLWKLPTPLRLMLSLQRCSLRWS
jgi:putative transposase